MENRKKAHLRRTDPIPPQQHESRIAEGEGGREADDAPSDIAGRGWREILTRTFRQVRDDRLQIVAGALAFFALLAAFPTLIAVVSIYGLVSDPEAVQDQMADLTSALPPETAALVSSQLSSIVDTSTGALGWTALFAILGALWSASSGMQQLIKAVNIAYDEEETRGFLRLRGLALLMTLGLVVFLIVSLGLIVAAPVVIDRLELGTAGAWALEVGRFVVLAGVFLVSMSVLYRYAPDREAPRWRWVSWGAAIATLAWIIASVLFAVFVAGFGTFQETYGALAGVIVLLLWFFITGFVVLLGAELNSEMEDQASSNNVPIAH